MPYTLSDDSAAMLQLHTQESGYLRAIFKLVKDEL